MNEMNNNIPQLNSEGQQTGMQAAGTSMSSVTPNVQNISTMLNNASTHATSSTTSSMNVDPGMNLANHLTNETVTQSQPTNMTPSATLGTVTPNMPTSNNMSSTTSGGENNTGSGNSSTSNLMKEPSSANNAPKKNKSPLFAVIVFLILGGFIFGLPYINEYKQEQETKKQQAALEEQLKREEEEQQQAEDERQEALEEEKKIKTSICTSPASNQGTFTLYQTQTFEYKDDKILSVSVATSRTYLQEDAGYEAMKTSCQTQADPLTTPSQEGYSVDCEIDNLTITLTESYDLETFETFTTSTGESKVAPYRYQQSFSEVQKTLEASQTVCK